MSSFLKHFLIFLLPIALIVLLFEVFFYLNGDLTSIEQAIEDQFKNKKSEALFLRRDFPSNPNIYKTKIIKIRKPEVLAIGSSRVLQFRSFMFSPYQENFYTAGSAVQSINDIEEFINQFEASKLPRPKVLIVGLDPWMIKTNFGNEATWVNEESFEDEILNGSSHIKAIKTSVETLSFTESFPFNDHVGANGKLGRGFRKDGSMNYGEQLIKDYIKNPRYIDREKPPVIERINKNLNQFSLPAEVDYEKVKIFLSSIEKAKNLGIEVIVFLPPFSENCFDQLSKQKEYSEWWNYYSQKLPEELLKNNTEYIGTIKPSQINLDDRYMIDGFHPGEVLIANQWLAFLKNRKGKSTSILNKIDTSSIEEMISHTVVPLGFSKND